MRSRLLRMHSAAKTCSPTLLSSSMPPPAAARAPQTPVHCCTQSAAPAAPRPAHARRSRPRCSTRSCPANRRAGRAGRGAHCSWWPPRGSVRGVGRSLRDVERLRAPGILGSDRCRSHVPAESHCLGRGKRSGEHAALPAPASEGRCSPLVLYTAPRCSRVRGAEKLEKYGVGEGTPKSEP